MKILTLDNIYFYMNKNDHDSNVQNVALFGGYFKCLMSISVGLYFSDINNIQK